ncbi:hypothetical protein JYG34_09335 [Pseudomonas entomophila]|uniref:hypothetical protein n=1 Tax=Pseudomonas entomophila TaxID=312306 RepID=UPI001BCD52F0|nr:hypothetical protein [Pseudomonas entomophila]QVM93193.1 hypothetical protein JYG34_09335 [Pseudomonas entomophila]
MAFYFKYQPQLSFIARWWWQEDGKRIDPLEWRASRHLLKPIWVGFERGDGEDEYLRTESREGSLQPWSPLKGHGGGTLHDLFWFGAYERNGHYYYQIRPVSGDVDGSPSIDTSYLDTDAVGYMGMYPGHHKVPEWVIYIGEDMWQLRGVDPQDLIEGERCVNVAMLDVDDNPVTRRLQSRQPYLYTGSVAYQGRVSLHVLKRPFPALESYTKRN